MILNKLHLPWQLKQPRSSKVNKMKLSQIVSFLNIETTYPDIDIHSVEIDTRTLKKDALFVALKGDHFDGHDFIKEASDKGAACILASSSISTHLPVIQVKDTQDAITCLSKNYRQAFNLPVVGITGSCGKTTTKTLIAKIFEKAGLTLSTEGTLNNHIGVPLTLMRLKPEHKYAVIEMGANHPNEIAHLTNLVRPTTALITNIAPVHLEGFGSLDGIAQSKSEIFQGLDEKGTAIINADEPYAESWKKLNKNRSILTFGIKNKADITASSLQLNKDSAASFILNTPQEQIPIQLKLIGEHQVMNAIAAAACAYAQNIPLSQIKTGLESLEEVNRRLCHHQTPGGIKIIDDSYNANPSSTTAALNVLKKTSSRQIFVFGDMLELGADAQTYHEKIGSMAKELGIEKLYAFGDLTKFTVKAFGKNAFHFKDKSSLITALKKDIDTQTTLLIKGSKKMKMWEVTEALCYFG